MRDFVKSNAWWALLIVVFAVAAHIGMVRQQRVDCSFDDRIECP